jgi:hypothetical protein
MARDFDLHARCDRTPGRTIPFEAGRRRINHVRPISVSDSGSEVSLPGFWPRSLAGAGPGLLLAAALLCTLYPVLKRKNTIQQSRPETVSQPSSPVAPPAEPAAIPSAITARPAGLFKSARPSHADSSLPGLAAMRGHRMRFEATHKKAFGSCTGQLELTSAALHFTCSHEADLDIPVSSIASTHKDGVLLGSGEKYHFLIADHTKVQVETIFNLWLSSARQIAWRAGNHRSKPREDSGRS